jgi:hypothetical protein
MLAHHRLSQPIYTISSTRIQRARDAPCRPSSAPFRPSSAPRPLLSRLSTLCCRCCCCFFCVSCTRRRLTASGGVTGIPVFPLFRGRSWSCMTTISPCQVGGATLCPPRWMQARHRLLAPLPCHPADWLFQKILTKAERHPHHRGPATPIPHLHPLLPLLLLPLLSRLPPPLLPLLLLLLLLLLAIPLRLHAAAGLRPHGDLIFCWAAIDCFRGFFSFSSTGSLTLVWLQSWSVSKPWSSLLRLHLFRRGRCSIMPIDAVGTDDANQQDRKRR